MLKKLSINNFALIDSVEIEFPNGLIIITGETGAGKSILMGGLSLLLGGKADSSSLLDKERNCIVEGIFSIDKNDSLRQIISEYTDIDESDNELIIRRIVSSNGRSRAFINDSPITLSVMSEISSHLIDIHEQHSTLMLNESNYQMNILDYFAGTKKELEIYQEAYNSLQNKRSELKKLEEKIAINIKELDYKQFQLETLQNANLKDGELEELETEQQQLSTAEEYRNALCSSLELLNPQGTSIIQIFKEINHILEKHIVTHNCLEDIVQRFESLRIECRDLEECLETSAEKIIISPKRLEEVENRLSILYSLLKKYNASTISELIELKENLEKDIRLTDSETVYKEKLEKEIQECINMRNAAAKQLSERRHKKIKDLSNILQERIRQLEMPDANFTVSLYPTQEYTLLGNENVQFLFSANKGIEQSPIQKAASGGELSRIMLCLKWLMAKYIGLPTMIFDEIDTGVSGRIADKMGVLINELGNNMQIISITHLPQIASKGDTHVLVYKENINGKTETKLKLLTKEERVLEIARMLSGDKMSDAAINNANFLLNN